MRRLFPSQKSGYSAEPALVTILVNAQTLISLRDRVARHLHLFLRCIELVICCPNVQSNRVLIPCVTRRCPFLHRLLTGQGCAFSAAFKQVELQFGSSHPVVRARPSHSVGVLLPRAEGIQPRPKRCLRHPDALLLRLAFPVRALQIRTLLQRSLLQLVHVRCRQAPFFQCFFRLIRCVSASSHHQRQPCACQRQFVAPLDQFLLPRRSLQ